MNSRRYLPVMLAVLLSVGAGVASAETTVGKVVFLGTIFEEPAGDGFHAQLQVRVRGTCDNVSPPIDPTVRERLIVIRSGRTDGLFAHNGVNMRNAYSTLLAALLAEKDVQIDGMPGCGDATGPIFMELWRNFVGILSPITN